MNVIVVSSPSSSNSVQPFVIKLCCASLNWAARLCVCELIESQITASEKGMDPRR